MELKDRMTMVGLMLQLARENAQDACSHIQQTVELCQQMFDTAEGNYDTSSQDAEAMLLMTQYRLMDVVVPSHREGQSLDRFVYHHQIPDEAIAPSGNLELADLSGLEPEIQHFFNCLKQADQLMQEHHEGLALLEMIARGGPKAQGSDWSEPPEFREWM